MSDFQGCATPLVEQLSNIGCCKGGKSPRSPASAVWDVIPAEPGCCSDLTVEPRAPTRGAPRGFLQGHDWGARWWQ